MTRDQIVERVWGKGAFLDTDNSINAAISKIRQSLGDDPARPRFVQTLTGRGYRFIAAVEESGKTTVADAETSAPEAPGDHLLSNRHADGNIRRHRNKILLAAAIILATVGIFAGLRYRSARVSRLTAKDTVVLADFSNNTGDAVFDGSLKQALKVALSQSPFLNILPERKVRATLKLMTQPANTPIFPSIAREVCQRSGSKAYISGAIASLDTDYVIGLKAENCLNGTTLAQEQITARSKDGVVSALGAGCIAPALQAR